MILAHLHRLKEAQVGTTPTPSIQFRAATNGVFRGGFNPGSVTLSGLTSGDFVIAILADDSTASPPLDTDWTNINVTTATQSLRAAYIFATGSSVTYTATFFSGSNGSMVLTAFSGVNSSTPLDVTSTLNVASSTTSITPASITTSTDNCMIFAGLGAGGTDITVTDPTGYTRADKGSGGVNNEESVTVGVYKNQSTSGTETIGSFGLSASRNARTITIALRPA